MSTKILQILYSGLGGHSSVAFTFIEASIQHYSVDHFLIFYGIEPVAPGYADACSRLGIPYLYVSTREGQPWSSWSDLVRAIRRVRPDAVILHSIKAIAAARFALSDQPLIAVEHQPNALKSRAEWVVSAIAQLLANRVVMLSPDYNRTIRSHLGPLYSSKRTAVVPTGINLLPFLRKSVKRPLSTTVRIGMAARFSPTKAQITLVEAVGSLLRSYPEINWQLTLPGDGVCQRDVAEAINLAGLQQNIELPGHLPSDQLPAWFSTLDVYAHSSDGETLSTALLQAMAAGVPIVASDVLGISDLLGPPSLGELPLARLVPSRDSKAFAQAIHADVADPAQSSDRSARARLHVMQHHSPEAMLAGYSTLLHPLL